MGRVIDNPSGRELSKTSKKFDNENFATGRNQSRPPEPVPSHFPPTSANSSRSSRPCIMNPSRDKKENAKRRKITVACDDCRARKVRCDGVQPGRLLDSRIRNVIRANAAAVCGPCSRRSDHTRCVYTGDIQKKRETQTYITPH